MKIAKAIQRLIENFEKLPGIGPKTASRLTFYLLHVPQKELDHFSQALADLKRKSIVCSRCFNIADTNPCPICSENSRDQRTICVVEEPLDVMAMEKIGKYEGVYHVLGGRIDPLNNIRPEDLKIGELLQRIKENEVEEVILATNPDMEGEATAMYIRKKISNLKSQISNLPEVTRLGQGLPTGGDLEYADKMTLTRALEGRSRFD